MFCCCLNGSAELVVQFSNIFFQIPHSILHTFGLLFKLFLSTWHNNKTSITLIYIFTTVKFGV
jgi:hypothetical protein